MLVYANEKKQQTTKKYGEQNNVLMISYCLYVSFADHSRISHTYEKKKEENKLKRSMDNRKMVDDIVLLMFVQMGKILNAECTMYI